MGANCRGRQQRVTLTFKRAESKYMSVANFANRTLYHLDNLQVLRGMNSETIDLIATDPPFNKNRDFYATSNNSGKAAKFEDKWSWDEDVNPDWVDDIKSHWPAAWITIEAARVTAGSDMAAFLYWLGIRLIECHRVLKGTGSLYLHLDYTAHAYAKCLLDSIFGRKNFRNEIVWHYKTGGVSNRWFNRKHDTILFYSKTRDYVFNSQQERSYLSHRYGFSNVTIHEDEKGYYTMVGARDVWDIAALRGNQPENAGYPTQKPLALYERIVKASSNLGGVVLDPFCGSATTMVAAERLGRQWVGIDICDEACKIALERLKRECPARLEEVNEGPDSAVGVVLYKTEPPVGAVKDCSFSYR